MPIQLDSMLPQQKIVHKEKTFESVDEFLEYWSGTVTSENKLKSFKENHEKELVSDSLHLETLCMLGCRKGLLVIANF